MPDKFDNTYFRDKHRERRKRNPLLQKKFVYIVNIDNKKYAILQKSKLKIDTISVDELSKHNDIIQCF